MEGKKISFGFKKTKKIEKVVEEEKKDYIECVEEKSIKVIGGESVTENSPIIIPMKPNTLITAEKLKAIAEKVEKDLEEPEIKETKSAVEETVENETIDQMAVRELLLEAKKEYKPTNPTLTVPLPANPILEGKKESTLDDYEAVPIQEFGLAMLRGMGWSPGDEKSKYKEPLLRPKGLGLGADKVVSDSKKNKTTNQEEELSIIKNSYVKITTGKHNGYYGKVVSLDEENGRVMVEITMKKEVVSLSEFMMQAVTKAEFEKESKVINRDTYEQYKKSEKIQNLPKVDSSKNNKESSSYPKSDGNKNLDINKKEISDRPQKDDNSNGKSRDRRYSSSTDEDKRSRRRKKEKKKHNSSDSDSSGRNRKQKHKKSKKRYKESESDSSDYQRRRSKTPDGKRDIDKKRKGKKKKRDRDRSPNYRKHRK